jgi:hypothetical protein
MEKFLFVLPMMHRRRSACLRYQNPF